MNSETNAMPDAMPAFHTDSTTIAPAARIPETTRLYWSVRRELWENPSIYIAPLAVAALLLTAFLISILYPPSRAILLLSMGAQMNGQIGGQTQLGMNLAQPYDLAAALIMASTFIVSIFYCLDALYGERRDRSILFWKSLPLSDLTTVLSKAIIPLLILPLLTFAITIAAQCLMLLMNLGLFAANGVSTEALRSSLPLFKMSVALFYHLFAIHALWYAPIYAWLLLVSSWARRAPLLWATLPVFAVAVVELIAFRSHWFLDVLKYRFSGGPDGGSFTAANMAMDPLMHLAPLNFLATIGLWNGLALAAIFLAAAIRLRHYRNPL